MDDNDIDLALRLGDLDTLAQLYADSEDVQSLLPAVPADWTPGEAGEVIQVFLACFLGRLERRSPMWRRMVEAERRQGARPFWSKDCRRQSWPAEAPCMITSVCGTGMARWIASIMRSTSSVGKTPSAKPAPRPASSIAKA